MFQIRAKSVASVLAGTLLVWRAAAFGTHLSDQAVREAYFLGQRNDEKTAQFLDGYLRRLPMPQSGLYVSEIELFTPYAEAVARWTNRLTSAQEARHRTLSLLRSER